MKRNHKRIAVLSTLITASAYAEFDVPRSAFGISELEEAKAKATEEEEPLVFVITDPATK